jgi:8-oxo-dGTP pyrophosphatase MutT (NUDIX family)
MNFKREFSAGGVVYKKTKGQNSKIFFLLGKHSGYHKWVLPKGLIELGEKSWQTAVRETKEEMGVEARLIKIEPIHEETYFYVADLKKIKPQNAKDKASTQSPNLDKTTRRIIKYQEEGGGKTKVFKKVVFYLMEYVSGQPEEHGWEMEEAGWFSYNKAIKLMAFKGEKEALKKAYHFLKRE